MGEVPVRADFLENEQIFTNVFDENSESNISSGDDCGKLRLRMSSGEV